MSVSREDPSLQVHLTSRRGMKAGLYVRFTDGCLISRRFGGEAGSLGILAASSSPLGSLLASRFLPRDSWQDMATCVTRSDDFEAPLDVSKEGVGVSSTAFDSHDHLGISPALNAGSLCPRLRPLDDDDDEDVERRGSQTRVLENLTAPLFSFICPRVCVCMCMCRRVTA